MIENLTEFVEDVIQDFGGYIWEIQYGDYIIGTNASIRHLGVLNYENFTGPMAQVESFNSYDFVISKPKILTFLSDSQALAIAANGGTLPPPPAPQYTIEEAIRPNNTFWQIRNQTDRTVWFPVRVKGHPMNRTFDYRFRLVEQGI